MYFGNARCLLFPSSLSLLLLLLLLATGPSSLLDILSRHFSAHTIKKKTYLPFLSAALVVATAAAPTVI